jgi:hypothetical protein
MPDNKKLHYRIQDTIIGKVQKFLRLQLLKTGQFPWNLCSIRN